MWQLSNRDIRHVTACSETLVEPGQQFADCQQRSRHNHVAMCEDTTLLEKVATTLDAADCAGRDHMQCAQDLLTTLAVKCSLPASLTNLLPQWTQMLQKLYSRDAQQSVIRSDVSPDCSTDVKYQPVGLVYGENGGADSSKGISNLVPNTETYLKTCHDSVKNTSSNMVNLADPWIQFTDVLLVVVFNNPLYNVIPYVEMIYRSFFPFILYCGPQMISTKTFPSLEKYTLSITCGNYQWRST